MDKIISLHNEFNSLRGLLKSSPIMADDICYEVTVNSLFDVQHNKAVDIKTSVGTICYKHGQAGVLEDVINAIADNITHIAMKIKSKVQENNNGDKHYYLRYVIDNDQYIITNEE